MTHITQAKPRERPILFQSDMVRALLAGTKTQTRRIVKPQPPEDRGHDHVDQSAGMFRWWAGNHTLGLQHQAACPYGRPGDRLWVREAWARTAVYQASGQELVVYREGDNRTDYGGPWKPSIHMFRRDSRILLEITEVRVERLQNISESDARAEGITDGGCLNCGNPEPCGCTAPAPDARDSYAGLWMSINGEESWAANPLVWCVSFRVVKP